MSGKNTGQEVFIGDGVSSNPITVPILPLNLLLHSKSGLLGLKKKSGLLYSKGQFGHYIFGTVFLLRPLGLARVRRVFVARSQVGLVSFSLDFAST